MSNVGLSFTSGLRAGADARDAHYRRKLAKEEIAATLERDSRHFAAEEEMRKTVRQNEIERNNRFLAEQKFESDYRTQQALDQAIDPRNMLGREKAQRELDTLRNPPPPAPPAPAPTPAPAPVPTARVKQAFGPGGKSMAEYEVPVSQLDSVRHSNPADSYRSSYDRDIAELDRQEAAQRAEIASGDKRTGLFNWNSREDIATKAQSQRLHLEARRLQEMVQKGVISQEEADERADALMAAGLR